MELILNQEEIEFENNRMILESDTLVSLLSYPTELTNKQLKDIIISDPLPTVDIDIEILKNRNLKNIGQINEVKKGILINKSTLRYLPTKNSFYSTIIKEDNIATILSFLTPILIIHNSLDENWFYIQSYYYKGWIAKDDVKLVDDSEFIKFLFPNEFVIITDKNIEIENIVIDMGVKIPLLAKHEAFYEILIPTIKDNKIVRIDLEVANIGYLDYTKENILKLAYKYLNTPYKWGGIDNGIDCSLLIVNIFKTVGLLYPRDTKEQENIIGLHKINLKGKTEEEKKAIISETNTPYLLYKQGHVLLGINNTEVIHAYGDAAKVLISNIDNSCNTNLYPLLTSIICLYKHQDC